MNEEDKENLKWLHVFKYVADLIVLLFLIIDKEISTALLFYQSVPCVPKDKKTSSTLVSDEKNLGCKNRISNLTEK